jgi:NAD(P)-dependent dehydrogenase (short-subunit alcohol dehydrogenase family)
VELGGARALVVGASSGVGKATCEALAGADARVVGAARRPVDAPYAVSSLHCDVRDPADCTHVVAEAVETLGGLDALVYAAGVAPLIPLADLDQDRWLDMLRTNVVGASLVTAAAVPHLSAAAGRALYLSSHSVSEPWPGLSGYAASKAALDTMVRGWRAECPDVSFHRAELGPTLTGFADGWEPERLRQALADWEAGGYLKGRHGLSKPADVAAHLLAILSADVRAQDTRLLPP